MKYNESSMQWLDKIDRLNQKIVGSEWLKDDRAEHLEALTDFYHVSGYIATARVRIIDASQPSRTPGRTELSAASSELEDNTESDSTMSAPASHSCTNTSPNRRKRAKVVCDQLSHK